MIRISTFRRGLFTILLAATCLALPAAAAERVLVFGASGKLGAEVVRALAGAGYAVTAFVRPGSDRARLEGVTVDYATGDLLVAADVAAAFAARPVDAVVDASARGSAPDDFYPRAMRNIVAAASAAGRPVVILHGSVGAGENAQRFPQAPFGRMAATLAAKGEAEDLLRASGLPWVIIRNGILAPDATPATGKAVLSDDESLMRTVTRADLARLTVGCLATDRCRGRTWHAVDASLPFPERYR
jgi:uncharacterized protein YbjT (DUF2867 family)